MRSLARSTAKRLGETLLASTVARPRRMKGHALILAYHNVVPNDLEGLADRSLHLPWSRFLRQLDLLQKHCTIRRLEDLLREGPDPEQPTIAITFDDAYRGAVQLALPEVSRRGLPATLFVAPGLLGARSFWWDELASETPGLPEGVRQAALNEHQGDGDRILAALRPQRRSAPLPRWLGCATAEEVLALDAHPGIQLGAHSWSHRNLTLLSDSALDIELTRPLDWLRNHGVSGSISLAYPYGLTTATVTARAAATGYSAGLLVEGGWFTGATGTNWDVPRYNVPAGLSTDGFRLRLSGYWVRHNGGAS